MDFQGLTKEILKKEITRRLSEFPEVRKVIIFGSFLNSQEPNDIDIAVFQDSDEGYYPLAMKYRRNLRVVSNKLPIDIIPLRPNIENGPFIEQILNGEVLYER